MIRESKVYRADLGFVNIRHAVQSRTAGLASPPLTPSDNCYEGGPTGTEVTLPDVGLGYNQVLPIIVQGLLTPPGALVIFEQPEIHLHPEIHARLIDFFSGLARTGRWVLIETHSTYMVDNLCLAIVKDRSNWLLDASQVLFVHPPDENAASARIELVKINRYGKILNYPPSQCACRSPHFLPDVAVIYEQIIKESFAKRREERAAK